MSTRAKALFIIIGGIVFIVVMVWLMIVGLRRPEPAQEEVFEEYEGLDVGNLKHVENSVQVAQGDELENYEGVSASNNFGLETELSSLAATFTERFGSYSSDSDYSNIKDLQTLMTLEMAAWSEIYIDELSVRYPTDGEFYGVSSRVISVKTNSLNVEEGNASFTLTVQRSETFGVQSPVVKYQTLAMRMLYDGNAWKVDFAKWE